MLFEDSGTTAYLDVCGPIRLLSNGSVCGIVCMAHDLLSNDSDVYIPYG